MPGAALGSGDTAAMKQNGDYTQKHGFIILEKSNNKSIKNLIVYISYCLYYLCNIYIIAMQIVKKKKMNDEI